MVDFRSLDESSVLWPSTPREFNQIDCECSYGIAIFLVFTRRRIVSGSAVPEGPVQFQHSHRNFSLWAKSDDQREWDSSRLSTQDSSNYPYNSRSRDTGASWTTSLRFCKRASCAEHVLMIWRQFWVLSVPPGVYPELVDR